MRQIQAIPEHMMFQGEIPTEAKTAVLTSLVEAENELSEWQKKRLGRITCSMFGKITKVKSGAWGETALSYLYDLIGEHMTGKPSETFTGSKATDWGNLYEEEALKAYTKRTGRKTRPAGFFKDAEMNLVGGTPDALCGEAGVIEVKCPLTYKNHLRTVITKKVPSEYMDQVLGHMMLTGKFWCDFVSYDPRIKGAHRLVIVRVNAALYQDEMKELAARIIDFHELLVTYLKKLKVKSIHPQPEQRAKTPFELGIGFLSNCCYEPILAHDASGHGKCSKCKENTVPAEDEPDYDNQAREYEETQWSADAPTPYDP